MIEPFKGRVYGLAYRMTFDSHLANDLSQEVFLHLFQNIHKFDQRENMKPWLMRVAKNYIINRLQKKRLKTASLDVISEKHPAADPIDAPDEKAVQDETYALLRDAVKSLHIKYRALVAMRYDEDMSIKEIADASGTTAANVKIRLFRAREILRKKLSGKKL